MASPGTLSAIGALLDSSVEDLRGDLEGAVDQVKAAIQAAVDVGPHRWVWGQVERDSMRTVCWKQHTVHP